MANIYPIKEDLSELPFAELKVYEALKKLGKNFYVFHSVQWLKKTKKWTATWKENDFLIINRNLGALVLEVKGGDIEYTGTVFHQINTQTEEVAVLDPKKKKDPLSQAIDGAYHYREVFEKISRATETRMALDDRFPVEVAVWFPGCEIGEKIKKFPLAYREAEQAVLDLKSFEEGPQAIYDVFDFYGSREKVDITDYEFNKILEAIASDFELITAPAVKKEELDYAFLKLTHEQMGLLDYISEQRFATIQGVAGTGKTLIAKEAAKNFGEQGRKVLFLCFNKFLYADLKRKYPYTNVTYYNIHSFIKAYGNSTDDLSNSDKRAEILEGISWDDLDFDDVVIDEAQDFHDREIIYFKEFAELKDGRFFAFYDKNQVVQTDKVPEWIEKSECRLLLTKNCRNTYEIALTAYNVIDVELNQKIQMMNGEKTRLTFVQGNPMGKLVKLLRMLIGDKYGYDYSDIVILTLKTESESIMNNIVKISGIPITREKSNSSILFTTAKKFKGLESRVIIIVDIDEASFNDEKKKRNFYVACSRATQYLLLVVDGDDQKVKSIADCISGPNYAPKGKIAMKTQAALLNLD
jgi:hypothetical protein